MPDDGVRMRLWEADRLRESEEQQATSQLRPDRPERRRLWRFRGRRREEAKVEAACARWILGIRFGILFSWDEKLRRRGWLYSLLEVVEDGREE